MPVAHHNKAVQKNEFAEAKGKHLRKTARGASSPAKPALHIPELAFEVSISDKSGDEKACR